MSTSQQYLVDTEAKGDSKGSWWQSTTSSEQIEALTTRCTMLETQYGILHSYIKRVEQANENEIGILKQNIKTLTTAKNLTYQYIQEHDKNWYEDKVKAQPTTAPTSYLDHAKNIYGN